MLHGKVTIDPWNSTNEYIYKHPYLPLGSVLSRTPHGLGKGKKSHGPRRLFFLFLWCVHICVKDRGQSQVSFFRHLPHFLFEAGSLISLELYKISRLILVASELPGICPSVLTILPSLVNATIHGFYYQGSRNLNSRVHTYKTHALSTELCPQLLFFQFLDIYKQLVKGPTPVEI